MRVWHTLRCAAVIFASTSAVSAQARPASDIELHGTITPEKYQTHETLSFQVPAGVERLNVDLISPGFAKGMYLTAGLWDPQRYRGEGRSRFTLSAVDATGPYLPGPIVPGTWKLSIGFNYVAPGAHGDYSIRIHLSPQLDPEVYSVIRSGPGWFAGDLHAHTGLTDANCRSQSGKNVPCPMSRLLEAAARQHLDFLAVTDHNTQAHFSALAQEQIFYDQMLLIAAEEVTTVRGHSNVWGTEGFLDYRVAETGWTANDLFDQAHALHALVSINHAYWPWDGRCPGCGWAWADTDFRKVDAIEIINGYHEMGSWFKPPPGNGLPFWEARLREGLRPTGVGGGDDHRGGEQLPEGDGVGIPTTVVYARELSQPAILEGIKAGHVFVKVTGPGGPDLHLNAGAAMMGDEVAAAAGQTVHFAIETPDPKGTSARILVDGQPIPSTPALRPSGSGLASRWEWSSDGRRHWVRAELVDPSGAPVTLSNPIYVNWGH